MSIKIDFDPVSLVVECANTLWPGIDATVQYVDGLAKSPTEGPFGRTEFPDDGSAPVIFIDVATPISGAVEVLAHELAHVAAGIDAEHGPEWEAAFDAIHAEYCKRVKRRTRP